MSRGWLLAAMVLPAACAPGIRGGWEASGHLHMADAFDLALSFEDGSRAAGVFTTEAKGDQAVPVCSVKVVEQNVVFVIGTSGETSCSTLKHPLTFSGTLGEHVIAGKIRDVTGAPVGVWRAFRKRTP